MVEDNSTAPPTRLSSESRREQLVAAGLSLLKRMPLEHLSAADVAVEAGVSKALVFHYFPKKIDLHAEIFRAAADQLLAAIDVNPDLNPGDRLARGIEAFVTYLESAPETYLAIVGGAGTDPQIGAVFEEARVRTVRLIQAALGAEVLTPGLRIAVRGWIAMVEESVVHWLDERPVPRDQLITFLCDTAVAVLLNAATMQAEPPAAGPAPSPS